MFLYNFIFLLVGFLGALYDFLFYKIPNSIVIFLALGGILKALLGYSIVSFEVVLITFILTYFLYNFKVMGAGDVKFLSSSILWIPPQDVVIYFSLISFSGIFLSLVYVLFHKEVDILRMKYILLLKRHGLFKKLKTYNFIPSKDGSRKLQILIPYGVAIFMGYFEGFILTKLSAF